MAGLYVPIWKDIQDVSLSEEAVAERYVEYNLIYPDELKVACECVHVLA